MAAGSGGFHAAARLAAQPRLATYASRLAALRPTGTSFPGNTALDQQASLGCQARIAGNVDKSKITDAMSLNYLVPQEQSWADGHRSITCFIFDPTSGRTSSLLVSPATG